MTIFNSNVFPSPNISFGKFRYEKQKKMFLAIFFMLRHNRLSKTWMRSVKKETLFTIVYQEVILFQTISTFLVDSMKSKDVLLYPWLF
jgi:hypothetical protein